MRVPPLLLVASAVGLVACSRSTENPSAASTGDASSNLERPQLPSHDGQQLGDPIAGLTPAELDAFERGREVFSRRFKPSEGLGPLYNATSCASCHSHPVPGGSAPLYRNFYVAKIDFGSVQTDLPGLPSLVIPAFGGSTPHAQAQFTLEDRRREIPATFNNFPVISAQRNAIPIFGTGLFEFISDATIISNADPRDLDGDGISGRFNTDPGASTFPTGRFGVKAQVNNIEMFTRGPLQNQMGITSDPDLGLAGIVSSCTLAIPQGGALADSPTLDADGVPDPEISPGDLSDLIAFTKFLAPPRQKPRDEVGKRGEMLFESIGCVKCHIPELDSSRGPVQAYTDLLLHDMGPELADGLNFGIPQASPGEFFTKSEFRTQPLWGVAITGPFLHDGRAETLEEAIEMHGGEAQAIRDAFVALRPEQRASIIRFLEHL